MTATIEELEARIDTLFHMLSSLEEEQAELWALLRELKAKT